MHRFQALAAKLSVIGGSLLLAVLASISFTLYASWQLDGGAAADNAAGRMRMPTGGWRKHSRTAIPLVCTNRLRIARALNIAEAAVKIPVQRILRKRRITSQVQAAT